MVVDPGFSTRELLKGLGTLAQLTKDYGDTCSRATVFAAILGLITDIEGFRRNVRDLDFFRPPLVLLPLEHGMVAYTLQGLQMNIHFVIPKEPCKTMNVLLQMQDRLNTPMFEVFAINLRPLRLSLKDTNTCIKFRRRIPRLAREMTLNDDGYLEHDNTLVEVEHIIDDPRDVLQFTPLTRANGQQPDDTLYWTRTRCGKIAVFRNPVVPLDHADGMPPIIKDVDSIYTCFSPDMHVFLNVVHHQTMSAIMTALDNKSIPSSMKTILVRMCTMRFGIHDELIIQVGMMVERDTLMRTSTHESMHRITTLIHMGRSRAMNMNTLAIAVVAVLNQCEDQPRWREWVVHSKFMAYLCDNCEVHVLMRMCDEFSACRTAITHTLRLRKGRWSSSERRTAFLLQKSRGDGAVDEQVVAEEVRRLQEEADRILGEVLLTTEGEQVKTRDEKPGRRVQNRDVTPQPRAEVEEIVIAPRTHHSVVTRLSNRWPQFGWTLIGSGIFSDASDVDVVVTVSDASTLKEAYERVQRATGFELRGRVDGEHLRTFHATWEGTYPLDVQVTRDGSTPSELCTRRALTLARRLEEESDEDMRTNVRRMHAWFGAASLKGNPRGHLPGVAVTCIAVALASRRPTTSLSHSLHHLHDSVHRDVSRIDFDHWDDETSAPTPRRPETPLAVVVDEVNVASRLTTAWTRHLVDTLVFARTLDEAVVLTTDVYLQWRRRTMIYCTTVRPKTDGALALTLQASLSRFEGHPLVESYHVGADGPRACDVVLRCTLSNDPSPKYKFGANDALEIHDGHVIVTTVSSRRTLRLNASVGRGRPFTPALAPTLPTHHMFDAGTNQRIPNAPYLTTDAVASFSPTHWSVVS